MAWFVLIIAGLLETFAIAMISRFAFKKDLQTLTLLIVGFALSFTLLSYALQTIPMGTGYAVWTGIGVVGSSFVGMIFFREESDWKRLACIGVVLFSVVGLNLIS